MAKRSKATIDAKHRRAVASNFKAAMAGAGASTGSCTITFGGGFQVCQDGVTNAACNQVAAAMGGTPHFKLGGKCP